MPLVNVLINSTTAGVGSSSNVKKGNAPPPIYLDYLVVGGGGYSATNPGTIGAPGGGGGVVSGSIRFLPRFTLDVTVGAGGTGSTSIDAEASIIDVSSPAGEFFVYAGGGLLGTSGAPQSNPVGPNINNYSQGGGGGSSSPGFTSTNNGADGGVGGSGSLWTLDNIPGTYYAGGGGGFGVFFIPTSGTGGAGQAGGGNGASQEGSGTNGTPNTGGGAGGSQNGVNPYQANGGSGIVKMRYISGSVMGATGGTTSVSGGYVYHTFTGSGQFVYQP